MGFVFFGSCEGANEMPNRQSEMWDLSDVVFKGRAVNL
jgi:hypothetical protein